MRHIATKMNRQADLVPEKLMQPIVMLKSTTFVRGQSARVFSLILDSATRVLSS